MRSLCILSLLLGACASTTPNPVSALIASNRQFQQYKTSYQILISETKSSPKPHHFLTINAIRLGDTVSAYQEAHEGEQTVHDRWLTLTPGKTIMNIGVWLPSPSRDVTNQMISMEGWLNVLRANAGNPTLRIESGTISFTTTDLPESFFSHRVSPAKHVVRLDFDRHSRRIFHAHVETVPDNTPGEITIRQCFAKLDSSFSTEILNSVKPGVFDQAMCPFS